MNQKIILAPFLVVFCGLNQLSAALADEQKLAAADNAFAFKLLKQLAKDQPAANIFVSPYSVSTVLQMVGNGAVGQTKTEMQQVLGTAGLSASSLNEANKAIESFLNNLNTNVGLATANAIWYKAGEPVNRGFLALNQQFFGSTVATLDFADPHSVDVINAWANEKAKGRINRFADAIPENQRLFLANTVYFKGTWSNPFKPEDTKDRAFHLSGAVIR